MKGLSRVCFQTNSAKILMNVLEVIFAREEPALTPLEVTNASAHLDLSLVSEIADVLILMSVAWVHLVLADTARTLLGHTNVSVQLEPI
jgi:hypothetical protein